MTSHLLAMSVGPVQEFIAAARRTRDLWFGSHVLSEISKATARAVQGAEGQLIFPAPESSAELEEETPLNVANVILARIPEGKDAKQVAKIAKEAARDRWLRFAREGRREASGVIRGEIWDEQENDVVEFSAAWAPLEEGNYPQARARVMRLLAGRKNCRDFIQARPRPGQPKSSLDGLRDSVLRAPDDKGWSERARARLRVRLGEQLDVVGLVKRVSGGIKPYPSVARVAADPWLRGRARQLEPLIEECERLNELPGPQVIRKLDVSATGYEHFRDFPFEGTAVFRTRHHELEEETELAEGALQPLAVAVAKLGGQPNPYLAVIVADGDKMGETISRLSSPEEHRHFSAELSKFAAEATAIVNKHRGVLVYAGGDDVLAFVPLDLCLKCARELHDRFGTLLADLVKKLNNSRPATQQLPVNMTLSVGVAIGHFLENLEDLRDHGQVAEKDAKKADERGVKDSLAIHLHKRGGAPITMRGKWNDNPDQRIQNYTGLFLAKAIPSRLPYDLRRMADVYVDWPSESVAEAIRRDVLRLIAAKEGGKTQLANVAAALEKRVTDARSLREFAAELLVARQQASAIRQAEPRRQHEGSKR